MKLTLLIHLDLILDSSVMKCDPMRAYVNKPLDFNKTVIIHTINYSNPPKGKGNSYFTKINSTYSEINTYSIYKP